jgi:hypothetical protein
MKTCTGQRTFIAGILCSPPTWRPCNDAKLYRQNAAKRNLKYEVTETEQTGGLQRTEITPVLALTGQEFPRYLVGIFFAVFQNSHRLSLNVGTELPLCAA